MADLMDLYNGMGPGVGAMWAGQNQGNADMNAQMNRSHVQAQIEDQLARLKMAQESQPSEIAQREASTANTKAMTAGHEFTNAVNQGVGVDLAAQARSGELQQQVSGQGLQRQKNFWNDIANGTDLDSAMKTHGLKSGTPQEQQLRSMDPEALKKMGQGMHAHIIENEPKVQEEALKQEAETKRQIAVAKITGQFHLDAAKALATARLSVMDMKMNPDFLQTLRKAKTANEALNVVLTERGRLIADAKGEPDANQRLLNAKALDPYLSSLGPLAKAELNKMRQDGQIDMEQFNLRVRQIEAITGPEINARVPPGQAPGGAPPQQPPGGQPPGAVPPQAPPQGQPPQQSQTPMSPSDQQAAQWAQANQQDPRAKAIIEKLRKEGKIP